MPLKDVFRRMGRRRMGEGGEEAEKTLFRERKREGILYQDGHSRKT